MQDTDTIIEVAKLDDFEYTGVYLTKHGRSASPDQFLYLISRDAIIPVIEKQPEEVLSLIQSELSWHNQWIYLATARQLCIALLKATGKWKD